MLEGDFWWDADGVRRCKECHRIRCEKQRRAKGCRSHAELRAARRSKAAEWLAMKQGGMTLRQIADTADTNAGRVSSVISEFYPTALRRKPPTYYNITKKLTAGDRPWWSLPDDELLRLAAEARAEIERAEGFRRPVL